MENDTNMIEQDEMTTGRELLTDTNTQARITKLMLNPDVEEDEDEEPVDNSQD